MPNEISTDLLPVKQNLKKDFVYVTAVKDPFDPSSRETRFFPYEGKVAQAYIEEMYPEVFEGYEVIASMSGQIVDPAIIIPQPGFFVVFCLLPGDSNNVLRTIGQIAIMVVAAYVTKGLSLGWQIAATTAITMAGTMILNAILPAPSLDEESATSPSYSWSGVNIINEGFTAPVIYGRTKVLPYLIGKYITNIWVGGYATPDKQRMGLLYLLCDHKLAVIEDPKINGSPSTGYADATVHKRYGSYDQAVIPNFRDTRTHQSVNNKVPWANENSNWTEIEIPGDSITAIGIGISFPNGLAYFSGTGSVNALSVNIQVQYARQGTDNWISWINGTFSGAEATPLRYHNQTDYNGTPSQTPPYTGKDLLPDSYKIRYKTSTVHDYNAKATKDMYIDYVEGIVKDDFRYPGRALLGIDALATDQLSGGLPTVSVVVERRYVSVWTGAAWENKPANNPAWASYDMLVNADYGGNVSYTRMIYADFVTWAAFCTANGYTCDIVFDTSDTLPDALNKLGILGRGRTVQKGTNFGVVIDKIDTPVNLFGIGNIREGSFRQYYIAKKDRVNVLGVTYFDKDDDYDRKTFELRTSDFTDDSGTDINRKDLVLYGATSRAIATKHGQFLINCNEYLVRVVEFDVDVDALANVFGDVIYVSHDIPQWGYSGRIVSATANAAVLDREVTMSPGTTYHLLVRHFADDTLEEVALAAVLVQTTSATVTLSGVWTRIPSKDDVCAFGQITHVAKEFRIIEISRTHKQGRKIKALEYIEDVYDDSVDVPDYEDDSDLEPFVEGLDAVEVYKRESGLMVAFVSLTWRGFGLHYLYMKEENADTWSFLGNFTGNNWAEVRDLEPGKTYIFAVSTTPNPGDGVTDTITFKGWTAPRIIWPVTGLEIEGQGNNTVFQNKDLKLKWNLSTDTFPESAVNETFGAGTYPPMTEFGGYHIKILDYFGNLRREEFQFENRYNYSYERNCEDGRTAKLYFNPLTQRGTFKAGETIYQHPSGASAKIQAVGGNYLSLINITEDFVSGQIIYQADYGSELAALGDCSTDWLTISTLGWTYDADNDEYDCDGSQEGNAEMYNSAFPNNYLGFFILQITVKNYSAGSIKAFVWACNPVEGYIGAVSSNGVHSFIMQSTYNNPVTTLYIKANSDFVGSVDDISWKIITNAAIAASDLLFDSTGSAEDPESNLIIQVWARDKYGRESELPATISVSNPAPSAPSSLSATPHMKSIRFTWVKNTEIDVTNGGYYKFRSKKGTGDWSDWEVTQDPEQVVSLTSDEESLYGTEITIYFQVKAVDSFGNESSASESFATTEGLNIQSTDIDDFATTASKIFTKIPILESDGWTDNSPVAGSVAWNAHNLYYNGTKYEIEAGNTSLKYIFWDGASSAYSSSNTNPGLSDGQFVIATNVDGYHDLAWNANANEAIGSAYIQLAAILDAHILEVDAEKVTTGLLTGLHIVGNLIETSSSGKRVIMSDEGITLFITENVDLYGEFYYGDGTLYGSGALAFLHHVSQLVPFYIAAEQAVADFHYYNRSADPTGAAEVGDTCVVNGLLKICTVAGTPGTFTVVGAQTAP